MPLTYKLSFTYHYNFLIQYLQRKEYTWFLESCSSLKYWNYSMPKMQKCLIFTMSDLSLVTGFYDAT